MADANHLKRIVHLLILEIWKSGIIGTTNFGPSSYFIKGFVLPVSEEIENFEERFSFEKVNLQFALGIDPCITCYSEFKCSTRNDFTAEILANRFIGQVYLDLINGIIYLDVENA